MRKMWLALAVFALRAALGDCYLPAIGYDVPDRTFTRTEDNRLTDGTVSFAPRPPDWQYVGEFPVCIGCVAGGGRIRHQYGDPLQEQFRLL